MNIFPLKDADSSLVSIKDNIPICKYHGAMNKLTKDGIWRCVASVKIINNKVFENACKAGFSQRKILCSKCEFAYERIRQAGGVILKWKCSHMPRILLNPIRVEWL